MILDHVIWEVLGFACKAFVSFGVEGSEEQNGWKATKSSAQGMVLVCPGIAMSVLAFLGKSSELPVVVKAPPSEVEIALRPVVEAFRGRVEVAGRAPYKNVGDYDPVLDWHCGL
jgi:hypothetical protein